MRTQASLVSIVASLLIVAALDGPFAEAHSDTSTLASCGAQDQGGDDSGPSKAEAAQDIAPFPPPMEKREAKALLKELKSLLNSKEPRERAEAIGKLQLHSSELFIDPLVGLANGRDVEVAVLAMKALAEQNFAEARTRLIGFLRQRRFLEDETRMQAAIQGLGRLGWDKRGYAALRALFEECEAPTKKEILRVFAARRERQSFSLFVDLLDPPQPTEVHGANNPPASYWKEKYQEWNKLTHVVRKGLEQLTGKAFENAKAAIEWSGSKEARESGFQYDKGA